MNLQFAKHIYFDLDNTLWDFSGNSKRILKALYFEFKLHDRGIYDFEKFYQQYKFRNDFLWNEYRFGNVTKEDVRLNRFFITLHDFGIRDFVFAHNLADYYVYHTRNQTDLLPNALDVLSYLKEKYSLHIITNGFEEVQLFKLKNSGLTPYFKTITTAEAAGALKPDKKIFDIALQKINALNHESIYIGDTHEIDGAGALNAGMEFIWLNITNQMSEVKFLYEIKSLEELQHIL